MHYYASSFLLLGLQLQLACAHRCCAIGNDTAARSYEGDMASTSALTAVKQELQHHQHQQQHHQQQPLSTFAIPSSIVAGNAARDAVCSFSNCKKVPVYGWAGGSKPTRCRTHKADG
eukprot:2993-Heterococcus_DN1.PRE.1